MKYEKEEKHASKGVIDMHKYTIIGVTFWLGGFVLVILQVMSKKMGIEGVWMKLSIIDVFGKQYFHWIDSVSYLCIGQTVNYLISLPLCVWMFLFGSVLLLLKNAS